MPPTSVRYLFSEGFERKLLRLLLSPSSQKLVEEGVIRPEYFSSEPFRALAGVRTRFLKEYSVEEDLEAFREYLRISPQNGVSTGRLLVLLDEIERLPISKYAEQRARDFARYQAVKRSLETAAESFERGKIEEIFPIIDKARYEYVDTGQSTYDYDASLEERLSREEAASTEVYPGACPTGIERVDEIIDGRGLKPGEIGLVLALTGVGKSHSMISFAACGLARGMKILHVTIGDLSEESVARRYDRRLTGFDRAELQIPENRTIAKGLLEKVRGKIIIRYFPAGRLKPSALTALVAETKPDLLVVDYPMLMIPESMNAEQDMDQGRSAIISIYREIRGIARRFNIPCWAGLQASFPPKDDDSESFIPDTRSIALARYVAWDADLIFGLGQTDYERRLRKARIKIVKNREAETGRLVTTIADWARSSIQDETGEAP